MIAPAPSLCCTFGHLLTSAGGYCRLATTTYVSTLIAEPLAEPFAEPPPLPESVQEGAARVAPIYVVGLPPIVGTPTTLTALSLASRAPAAQFTLRHGQSARDTPPAHTGIRPQSRPSPPTTQMLCGLCGCCRCMHPLPRCAWSKLHQARRTACCASWLQRPARFSPAATERRAAFLKLAGSSVKARLQSRCGGALPQALTRCRRAAVRLRQVTPGSVSHTLCASAEATTVVSDAAAGSTPCFVVARFRWKQSTELAHAVSRARRRSEVPLVRRWRAAPRVVVVPFPCTPPCTTPPPAGPRRQGHAAQAPGKRRASVRPSRRRSHVRAAAEGGEGEESVCTSAPAAAL